MLKFRKKISTEGHKCLKCEYNKLMEQGKILFDKWDQQGKPPKELVKIQKKLVSLKKEISEEQIDETLHFCSEHPEIFEFLPTEWT